MTITVPPRTESRSRPGFITRLLPALLLAVMAASATAAPTRDELVGADYAQGRLAFQQRCSACHTLAEGGSHLVGPNLWGIIGREAGNVTGYAASPALKGAAIRWDVARLEQFLAGPEAMIPGTRMLIPEPVPAPDRVPMLSFILLETGAADWPKPEIAAAPQQADRSLPLSERFPSFWNHLMTNTTRYRMETPAGEVRFDAFFNTDGSVSASLKPVRGFWHVDERDFFCYALYGIPGQPTQLVECFPVVAMSIPRFAEELWVSKPVAGVTLHGGIIAGRP